MRIIGSPIKTTIHFTSGGNIVPVYYRICPKNVMNAVCRACTSGWIGGVYYFGLAWDIKKERQSYYVKTREFVNIISKQIREKGYLEDVKNNNSPEIVVFETRMEYEADAYKAGSGPIEPSVDPMKALKDLCKKSIWNLNVSPDKYTNKRGSFGTFSSKSEWTESNNDV
jgi:hypothetical protein